MFLSKWFGSRREVRSSKVTRKAFRWRPSIEQFEPRLVPSATIYGARTAWNPGPFQVAPGSVVRIDPATGAETLLWSGAAATADGPTGDIAVAPDGAVLFDGKVGAQRGIFRLEPSTPGNPVLIDSDAQGG